MDVAVPPQQKWGTTGKDKIKWIRKAGTEFKQTGRSAADVKILTAKLRKIQLSGFQDEDERARFKRNVLSQMRPQVTPPGTPTKSRLLIAPGTPTKSKLLIAPGTPTKTKLIISPSTPTSPLAKMASREPHTVTSTRKTTPIKKKLDFGKKKTAAGKRQQTQQIKDLLAGVGKKKGKGKILKFSLEEWGKSARKAKRGKLSFSRKDDGGSQAVASHGIDDTAFITPPTTPKAALANIMPKMKPKIKRALSVFLGPKEDEKLWVGDEKAIEFPPLPPHQALQAPPAPQGIAVPIVPIAPLALHRAVRGMRSRMRSTPGFGIAPAINVSNTGHFATSFGGLTRNNSKIPLESGSIDITGYDAKISIKASGKKAKNDINTVSTFVKTFFKLGGSLNKTRMTSQGLVGYITRHSPGVFQVNS